MQLIRFVNFGANSYRVVEYLRSKGMMLIIRPLELRRDKSSMSYSEKLVRRKKLQSQESCDWEKRSFLSSFFLSSANFGRYSTRLSSCSL